MSGLLPPSHKSQDDMHGDHNVGVPTVAKQPAVPVAHVPYDNRTTTRRIYDGRRGTNKRHSSIYAHGRPAQERHSKSAATTTVPLPDIPIRYTQTLPRNSNRYPLSLYSSSVLEEPPSEFGIIPSSASGVARTASHDSWSVREYQTEEWRSYPAFPSAYPPTPLPAESSLPSPVARSKSDGYYPPIPEDSSLPDFHAMPEQRLKQGLIRSSGKKSNYSRSPQDHTAPQSDSADDHSDDSDRGDLSEHSHFGDDSEVEFDRTLRTPYRYGPSSGVDPNASSSAVSLASHSTTLTTADNASSSHTRTSSGSDSSMDIKNRGISPQSRNATLRGRPVGAPTFRDPLQSSASQTADEGSDGDDIGVIRQKVLEPARRVTRLRPAARAAGTTRRGAVTAKLAPPTRARSATVSSTTRPARATGSNVSSVREGYSTRTIRGKAV